MKLNFFTTPARGTGSMAVAGLCLFLGLFFAGKAKADCSQLSRPRAIASFADSVITGTPADSRPGAQPLARTVIDPELAGPLSSRADPIVGLWLATFSSQGQIVDQGFDMWTSDGLEILNDTPPPATGNVCLGTWVRVAPNTYLLKHPSWTFDEAGNLNGTAIIRETIIVDSVGNTYKGTFTVDILTLSGNPILHLSGTLTGTRITVD